MEFWYQQRCGWAINKFYKLQMIREIKSDEKIRTCFLMAFGENWKAENLKKQIKVWHQSDLMAFISCLAFDWWAEQLEAMAYLLLS